MNPFLSTPPDLWLGHNDLAFAIRDRFPVSLGHTLVITKRQVETWWDATDAERIAVMRLVDQMKSLLDAEFAPDGYNVGFNAGTAAGQTVPHLHVHVIPRFGGDHPDPTGGVRAVLPEKANYLLPRPSLVTARSGHLHAELRRCLADEKFDRVDLVVAFVMMSGVRLLGEQIEAALARGARVRLLTTDYLLTTDVEALGFFLDRLGSYESGGSLESRVFSDQNVSFHPKAYLFLSSAGGGVAFVGSSNLSRSALRTGVEWNLETRHVDQLAAEFAELWDDPRATPLTTEWLADYRLRCDQVADRRVHHIDVMVGDETPEQPIRPWSVQAEALQRLEETRIDGHRAGLVVMATGLGKTWLAAFDTARPAFRRVLFVAHRQEILAGARDVFRKVRPGARFGMFVGGVRETEVDVLFASVQSLQQNLDEFAPDAFDYIVVDEFHHAAALTYRKVMSHFAPAFLLGLTATPDRTDAADLLALCADNLVYECGLLVGLHRGLLSPFRYRAIKDVADYEEIPWRAGRFAVEELSERLETQQRAQQVFDEWMALGGPVKRSFGFCCSITHADFMATFFVDRGVKAVAVHTASNSADRADSLAGLEDGDLQVIFSVDLFNEGVDVPAIDLVLMLRPTESPIVFFQQLGRGLRTAEGKTHLDVLDLVGNHRSFLRKARLLAALRGRPGATDREALQVLAEEMGDLPEGCAIVVDTEAIELMDRMLGQPNKQDRLAELIRQWVDDHAGERPTALEMALLTGKALELKKKGGWFGLLDSMGLLSLTEKALVAAVSAFLLSIEHGAYTKSYKLVTLRVLADTGTLRSSIALSELALLSRWRVLNDPRLAADVHDASGQFVDPTQPTPGEWLGYWKRNPINALAGGDDSDAKWFEVVDDRLQLKFQVAEELGPTFDAMVGELVDYRLHRYLEGVALRRAGAVLKPVAPDGTVLDAAFRVEQSLGGPITILFESSGGTRGSANARNLDYVAGLDLLLARLAALGAGLSDAYVDSRTTQSLPLESRRLLDAAVELSGLDLKTLRVELLKRVAKAGRTKGAGGNGNSRKALRFVLTGIGGMPATLLARHLVGGPDVLSSVQSMG